MSSTPLRTPSVTSAALPAAEAIALIEAAVSPGDLFGPDAIGPDAIGSEAAHCYRRLARLTHPDARPGDARAAAAFARLAALWQRHQCAGGPPPGQQADRDPLVARGDLANLYRTGRGLLKVARDPADNDLIDREAESLAGIARHSQGRFRAYFPRLAGTRRVLDPGTGAERHGNLIEELDGFGSLARVRAAFPGGVDPRDAAWMWRRLLVAVGAAHRAGAIHAAVLPEHVLIHPAEHGLVLVDWCYSGRPGGRLPAVVARYRDRYPPEVLAGGPAGPDTDIWLATSCMTELTGGRLPGPLAAFARGCMLASTRRRPQDAWQLLTELDELLGRLYGPRKFRPFAIPA